MKSASSYYCFAEVANGDIILKVKSDPNLSAGGDFRIFPPDSTEPIGNWKMVIDEESRKIKRILIDTRKLHNHKLAWKILCCSRNPVISKGKLEIEFLQNGRVLKTNRPIALEVDNVPPCAIKKAQEISGFVTIVVTNSLPN